MVFREPYAVLGIEPEMDEVTTYKIPLLYYIFSLKINTFLKHAIFDNHPKCNLPQIAINLGRFTTLYFAILGSYPQSSRLTSGSEQGIILTVHSQPHVFSESRSLVLCSICNMYYRSRDWLFSVFYLIKAEWRPFKTLKLAQVYEEQSSMRAFVLIILVTSTIHIRILIMNLIN